MSRKMATDVSLQITSMADVFIIILVFLLKSYATSVVNISPAQGMKLPQAHLLSEPTEALQIQISANSIQIENKPIVPLENFQFQAGELQSGSVSKTLNTALATEKERQKLIAGSNTKVKIDAKVLIIADQHTPYSTLKSVLGSAALNGFSEYKLVAVKSDGP